MQEDNEWNRNENAIKRRLAGGSYELLDEDTTICHRIAHLLNENKYALSISGSLTNASGKTIVWNHYLEKFLVY